MAAPKYKHIPKANVELKKSTENSNANKNENINFTEEKKQIEIYQKKISDMLKDADKAKKAAQIIERLLKK